MTDKAAQVDQRIDEIIEKKAKAVVKPLKRRTMGLAKLQTETLNMIRLVRFQLNRQPHEDGLSDQEFIETTLGPFEERIYQDVAMLRDIRDRKRKDAGEAKSTDQANA